MNIIILSVFLFLIWWAIGVSILVYEWTKNLNMNRGEFILTLVCGIIGPFMLVIAAIMEIVRYGERNANKIIFKQRKPKH